MNMPMRLSGTGVVNMVSGVGGLGVVGGVD